MRYFKLKVIQFTFKFLNNVIYKYLFKISKNCLKTLYLEI